MLMKNKDKCVDGSAALIYDEACLDIINTLSDTVTVAGQYAECVGCDFKTFSTLLPNQNTSLLINTKYTMQMHFVLNNKIYCE